MHQQRCNQSIHKKSKDFAQKWRENNQSWIYSRTSNHKDGIWHCQSPGMSELPCHLPHLFLLSFNSDSSKEGKRKEKQQRTAITNAGKELGLPLAAKQCAGLHCFWRHMQAPGTALDYLLSFIKQDCVCESKWPSNSLLPENKLKYQCRGELL